MALLAAYAAACRLSASSPSRGFASASISSYASADPCMSPQRSAESRCNRFAGSDDENVIFPAARRRASTPSGASGAMDFSPGDVLVLEGCSTEGSAAFRGGMDIW